MVENMNPNPSENKPQGNFADFANVEPFAGKAVGSIKLALSNNGVQLGWLGKTDRDWAVLVNDPTKALVLEQYPYNNVNYYRIKGTSSYLSINNQAYVGFYNWIGARGWVLQGSNFICSENGQKLSLYSKDNAYLYAWDQYTVLDVNFEPQ